MESVILYANKLGLTPTAIRIIVTSDSPLRPERGDSDSDEKNSIGVRRSWIEEIAEQYFTIVICRIAICS